MSTSASQEETAEQAAAKRAADVLALDPALITAETASGPAWFVEARELARDVKGLLTRVQEVEADALARSCVIDAKSNELLLVKRERDEWVAARDVWQHRAERAEARVQELEQAEADSVLRNCRLLSVLRKEEAWRIELQARVQELEQALRRLIDATRSGDVFLAIMQAEAMLAGLEP